FAGSRLDHEVGLLLRSWEPGRCWPGPADLSETLAKELCLEEERIFFENYHTTLLVREVLIRYQDQPPKIGISTPRITSLPTTGFTVERRRIEGLDPDLERTLIGFHSLLAGSSELEVNSADLPAAFESAKAILPAVEFVYWSGLMDASSAEMRAPLEDLASEDPLQYWGNPRFLRIWSVAVQALGTDQTLMASECLLRKLRGEIEQISYKTNSLDQGLLDRVLAAALLCEQPCASGDLRQLLMPNLERLLQMAVFRGDAYAFAPLLAYSIGLLTPSEATLRGWLSFLQSMIPRSLPYGWPSMKKVEDPNDLATS